MFTKRTHDRELARLRMLETSLKVREMIAVVRRGFVNCMKARFHLPPALGQVAFFEMHRAGAFTAGPKIDAQIAGFQGFRALAAACQSGSAAMCFAEVCVRVYGMLSRNAVHDTVRNSLFDASTQELRDCIREFTATASPALPVAVAHALTDLPAMFAKYGSYF